MLVNDINQKIIDALRAHDEVRLSTLRMLSSEFNYEKIRLQKELEESDEQNVIRKEARKRKDAIEAYQKILNSKNLNAKSKLEQEQKELEILQEFLPPELTEEEVNQLVDEAITRFKADPSAELRTGLGKVIADVKSKAPGVDGSKVAQIVREKLT